MTQHLILVSPMMLSNTPTSMDTEFRSIYQGWFPMWFPRNRMVKWRVIPVNELCCSQFSNTSHMSHIAKDCQKFKSTLVQVLASSLQAAGHTGRQCWPRSMSPYSASHYGEVLNSLFDQHWLRRRFRTDKTTLIVFSWCDCDLHCSVFLARSFKRGFSTDLF